MEEGERMRKRGWRGGWVIDGRVEKAGRVSRRGREMGKRGEGEGRGIDKVGKVGDRVKRRRGEEEEVGGRGWRKGEEEVG